IEELDNQLSMLLAGRDPVVVRRPPQSVEPPVPGEEVHAPVVATQTSRYESDDEARKLKLPRPAPPQPPPNVVGMVTGPTEEASMTLDPVRTRTLEREPPTLARRVASVLAVALAIVAISSGAFLLGIGVMWLAEPRAPDPQPPVVD